MTAPIVAAAPVSVPPMSALHNVSNDFLFLLSPWRLLFCSLLDLFSLFTLYAFISTMIFYVATKHACCIRALLNHPLHIHGRPMNRTCSSTLLTMCRHCCSHKARCPAICRAGSRTESESNRSSMLPCYRSKMVTCGAGGIGR